VEGLTIGEDGGRTWDDGHVQSSEPAAPRPGGIDISEHIRSHLDDLSPNDRRIARQLLDHPVDAPFETAESLATRVGVSKAAVVRFASRVGFAGFGELHEALAEQAKARLRAAAAGARSEAGPLLDRLVHSARADLDAVLGSIDRSRFDAAAGMLCKGGGKIGIFGHRKSAALAEYAYYLLNPLLPNAWPIGVGEPGIADQLIDLEPRDRLLAFTFRRYAKVTADVVRLFHAAGAPVVLVTDDLMAPAAAQADHVLVCPASNVEGFASSASGLVVLEALAAEIAVRKGKAGGRRLDAAEQMWREFGTY
jgi:DNA-binding MurR/RpiR family transcriptional regulator